MPNPNVRLTTEIDKLPDADPNPAEKLQAVPDNTPAPKTTTDAPQSIAKPEGFSLDKFKSKRAVAMANVRMKTSTGRTSCASSTSRSKVRSGIRCT
jgi:hypothetical protein